jgi:RNA polymerase-binding transcription factor DksA
MATMTNAIEGREQATRTWLLSRSAELQERIRRVESDLHREREPVPADSSEAAIVVENDEVLEQIRATALNELQIIRVVMKRLNSGTYSVCDQCGQQIEPARLEAVPYAIRCASCASEA